MFTPFLEDDSRGTEPQTQISSPSEAAVGGAVAGRSVGSEADRGMGGRADERGRRGQNRAGPLARAFRVRNLGGGVWGFGSIVGWIPADVSPWHFARRRGWVQIFGRRTGPFVRRRPYVYGDDGRYHCPERWRLEV